MFFKNYIMVKNRGEKMGKYIIKNLRENNIISQIMDIQYKYSEENDDFIVRGKEILENHPSFEKGRNIIGLFNRKGKILGYTAIFPRTEGKKTSGEISHKIWFDIIIDPEIKSRKNKMDLLLTEVEERAQNIKKKLAADDSELAVVKYSSEKSYIEFYRERNFTYNSSLLNMKRKINRKNEIKGAEDVNIENIRLNKSKLKNREKQIKYVNARNKAYPRENFTIDNLRWFLPTLKYGTAIYAVNEGGDIIGSIMIYLCTQNSAVIEDLFIIPGYRRRGFAEKLIERALVFSVEKNIREVELEVLKDNIQAVNLYSKMGFKTVKEELEFSREI